MKNLSTLLILFVLSSPLAANDTEKESGCTVTENSIKIDIDLKKGDMVKVFNLKARLVKIHEVIEDIEQLEVCDLGLSAGEYYLSVKSNGIPWSAGKITVK